MNTIVVGPAVTIYQEGLSGCQESRRNGDDVFVVLWDKLDEEPKGGPRVWGRWIVDVCSPRVALSQGLALFLLYGASSPTDLSLRALGGLGRPGIRRDEGLSLAKLWKKEVHPRTLGPHSPQGA